MKKNALIIILVMLLLGLGGYLVYDKVNYIDSTNNDSNEQVSDVKQYDLVEAKKLVDKYLLDFMFWENIFENGLREDDKIFLAIKYTNATKIDYSCKEAFPGGKDTGDQYIVREGFRGVCYDGDGYSTLSQYTYDSVNKTYKYLFGDENDLPKQMIFVKYKTYAYSEKYNAYIELSFEGGGAPYQSAYYDIESATETNNNLEIVVNYVDFDFNDYNKNFYVTNNADINISVDDPHNVTLDQMKQLYNRALTLNEKETYKIVFRKDNADYYLESMKKDIY